METDQPLDLALVTTKVTNVGQPHSVVHATGDGNALLTRLACSSCLLRGFGDNQACIIVFTDQGRVRRAGTERSATVS